MNKYLLVFTIVFIVFGCASKKRNEDHRSFMRMVEKNKSELNAIEYQAFVKMQLDRKKTELMQIESQLNQNERQFQNSNEFQENPTNSMASAYGASLTRHQLNFEKLRRDKRQVENEIFFLQSQVKSETLKSGRN